MRKKGKFVFGSLLIVAAVAYLVYAGIRETSTYYFTIDEFLVARDALANEGVRIAGRVQTGSISWSPRDLELRFVLSSIEQAGTDASTGVPVHYHGILPDMFAEGRDVIVEGIYGPGNALAASTILTSCPSKYEPELLAPH